MFVASSLQSFEVQKKICQFIASNLKAFNKKLIALTYYFSGKQMIASLTVTNNFLIIAAHHR
jgi:hypothetical protein